MKKTIAWIAIFAALLGLTACGSAGEAHTYTGTITELVDSIYNNCPQKPEFSLGETTAIDTSDANALKSFLGLTDGSQVEEAVYSEPMMSSQAYSLCALRVAEDADAKDIAQQVLDGVDPRKWICVEADQIRVGVWGDVIVLAMVSSSLSDTLADDIMTAFSETTGGELDLILKK